MLKTKFAVLVILMTSFIVSTQIDASSFSFIKSAQGQPFFPNNSENITNAATINKTQDNGNYQNYSSDFRILNDTKEWKRISGNWNYSLEGYQGSVNQSDDTPTPVNVILSPVNSDQSMEISTSFAISELSNQNPPYVSLVYAFQDPFNYRQAGINIQNGNVFVFANTIDDNVTTDKFLSLIPNANDFLTVGNPITMSLILGSDKKALFVNGIEFPISVTKNNTDGKVGLGYGGMQNIIFYDFKAQSITNSPEHPMQFLERLSEGVTIPLSDRSIPEDSYIPIYDSRPYKILDGHIAAKLPCNDESSSDVQIVAGNLTMMIPVELEIVPELSFAESMCLYQADVVPVEGNAIYDLILQNNSTDDIDFPSTSSIIVNIAKLDKAFE